MSICKYNLQGGKVKFMVGISVIDLIGQRFGHLVVLSFEEINNQGRAVWKCKCDCGDNYFARSDQLRQGRVKSCGCMRELKMKGIKHSSIMATNEIDRCKQSLSVILKIAFEKKQDELVGIAINTLLGLELDETYKQDVEDGMKILDFCLGKGGLK